MCGSGKVPCPLWSLRPQPQLPCCAVLGVFLPYPGPQFPCLENKGMVASVMLYEPALVPDEICSNPKSTIFLSQLAYFIRSLFSHLQNGKTDFMGL